MMLSPVCALDHPSCGGYAVVRKEESVPGAAVGDLKRLKRHDSPPGRGRGVGALGIRTRCEHRCTGDSIDEVQQRGPRWRPTPLSHVRLRRAGIGAEHLAG